MITKEQRERARRLHLPVQAIEAMDRGEEQRRGEHRARAPKEDLPKEPAPKKPAAKEPAARSHKKKK